MASSLYPSPCLLLQLAAEAWVHDNAAVLSQKHYSTSGNHFLWDAESAYFLAVEDAKADEELERMRVDEPEDPPYPPSHGFHLYRLWTEDARLLYVGVSVRLRNRLAVHQRRWSGLWEMATWEEYPDAASMLRAEADAVSTENPALNKQLIR